MERAGERPLRVAQIMGKLCGGGVESVIYSYYRHLDHTKVQFDFFVDDDSTVPVPQDILEAGAGCYVIPRYQHLPQNMAALYRHFKQRKYVIVHSNLNTLSVFPLCAAWLAGVPVRIAHSHSTVGKGDTGRNILKFILRLFAKVFATDCFACSERAGAWLFGKRAAEQGKVTFISNAIDFDRFKSDEDARKKIRKELGLEGRFVVGHVGRFTYLKNQMFLIDVFAEVHKKDPSAVLLLVGDGEDRAKIEEKIKSLRGSVILLGNQVDVYRFYPAMDVFVFPSISEGLGIAAVEAQACGLHVIASAGVPNEAEYTDGTVFLPLDLGIEKWADAVLSVPRDTAVHRLENWSHYDIAIQSERLERYYIDKEAGLRRR